MKIPFSYSFTKVLEAMKNDTPYEPTDEFLNPVKKRKATYFNDQKGCPKFR